MASLPPPPRNGSTGHSLEVNKHAFEDAYRRFFESLSEKERLLYSPCASHNDFITAMRKLEEVANKRRMRGGSQFLDRIARLSSRLQPFFEVVNIMIQSNPEYTALAWGALRFILQLASNFSTFFEKLIATLERFCDEIPQYESLQLFLLRGGQISARIRECTEKLYGYMFQFFREIANVFTSGGRIKRTPVVIADILWRPFENRFDSLLKQIQSCRSLIEFDILLLLAQSANNTEAITSAQEDIEEKEREENRNSREKLEELARMTAESARNVSQLRKEHLFERIQKWLSPPQYSDALFLGKSHREPGTNEWIFTSPRFCEWRDCEWAIKPSGQRKKTGPNILWIKGNPGTGKTVLASSIIDELTAAYRQDNQRWELCYFFFTPDCKESTTRISAYRSILAEIFHKNRQDDEKINKFDFIMTDRASSGTLKAGLDELFGLVKLLLQQFHIMLILDGIDECEDNSSLVGEIMELSEFTSAKFLLCGRTNTESLIRAVPTSSQICLDRETVNPDIRLFTSTQVDLLLDDELLPPDSNSEDLIERLCKGADGMFLWARLMFKYLGLPVHDPYSRLEVIWSVVSPEGLEGMYARIDRTISQAGKTSRDFASGILAWASYSMQPLTLEELYNQMTFDTSKTKNVASDQLKAFQERICIVCGGLIEFSEIPEQLAAHRILRYIHLSVKQHFSQGLRGLESRDPLVSPEDIGHLTCARMCLAYLLYHAPAQQGQLGHPEPSDPPLGPFSGYAARYWVTHLDRSFASASLNGSDISSALMRLAPNLSEFLRDTTTVKFWIHVLYSHPNPCTPDGMSSRLDELMFTLSDSHCFPANMGDLSKTMQQFCQTVSKALVAWDKHLRKSIDVLWDEMVIFIESPFIAGHRRGQVISMAPRPPSSSIDSNFSLVRKISHTGDDGETTAVVSLWKNLLSPTKSIVKYELWKHNTVPTRLFEIIKPIEHQPTVRTYPLSIGDDLRSFAALDQLFLLVPNGTEASVSTRSTEIPIRYGTSRFGTRTSFFKLSSQNKFLLSSDSSVGLFGLKSECVKTTMFEIESEGPLQVKPILNMNLQHRGYTDILEAIFHPSHRVVVVRGEDWIAAWNFAKENTDEPERSFARLHIGGKVKSMSISSCGKFVVFEDETNSQPKIVSIPERFLALAPSGFGELLSSPRSALEQDKSATESLLSSRKGDSALQLCPGRPVHSAQIVTQDDGTPVQLFSVQGGEEISISRIELQSNSTEELMNMIRLPYGQGMNEVAPVIIAPAPEDESVRIILNERGLDRHHQLNELPIFIERDIDAIRHTYYEGAGQRVDGESAAARQQIRNREESESEQATKRRRTGSI